MPNADDIARALADAHPIHYVDTYHYCVLCEEPLVLYPSDHKDTCPWRLAKEYFGEKR